MSLLGALLTVPSRAAAQVDVRQAEATRAQLESLYARLSPKERVYAEAVAIKERLDEGDFQTGDRISLVVRGDTALSDTFAVNANRAIELPNIGAVPLQGILRSELQAHMEEVLSHYLKSPEITTTSLIRIAVIGQVARPGFLYLSATSVAADAFAAAGGLTPSSDLKKTKITRNGQTLIEGQASAERPGERSVPGPDEHAERGRDSGWRKIPCGRLRTGHYHRSGLWRGRF